MVSKVFEHPFDLTKVRLQSQVLDNVPRFSGPVDCLTTTWKNEGIRGLYRVSINWFSNLCMKRLIILPRACPRQWSVPWQKMHHFSYVIIKSKL